MRSDGTARTSGNSGASYVHGRIVDNSVSLNIRALNYGNSICTESVKRTFPKFRE